MIPAGTEPVVPFAIGRRAAVMADTAAVFPWVGVPVGQANPGEAAVFPWVGVPVGQANPGEATRRRLGYATRTVVQDVAPFAWRGVRMRTAEPTEVISGPVPALTLADPGDPQSFAFVGFSSSFVDVPEVVVPTPLGLYVRRVPEADVAPASRWFFPIDFDGAYPGSGPDPSVGVVTDWGPTTYMTLYARHIRGIDPSTLDLENDDGSFVIQGGVFQAGWEGTITLQQGAVGLPEDSDLLVNFRPSALGNWGALTNWNWQTPTPPYDTYPVAPSPFPRFWRMEANDGWAYSSTDEIAFVTEDWAPIFLVGGTQPTGSTGNPYSVAITTIGGDPLTVGFSWSLISGALPPGLTLTPGTPNATLSGTPTTVGLYSFELEVTDGTTTDSRPFELAIADSTYLEFISITPADGTTGWGINDPVTYVIESDGEIDVANFQQYAGPAMSGGLIIDGTTHPGYDVTYTYDVDYTPGVNRLTVEYIPTGGWVPGGDYGAGPGPYVVRFGSYVVSTLDGLFTLTNPETGTFTLRFTVESAAAALEITTTSLPGGSTGAPYSADIYATGGSGAGYTWAVTAGALPPGLVLGASGTPFTTLTGTPTTAGSYNFTVRVTDSASATDTQAYTLVIIEAPPPPIGLRAGIDGGATLLLTSTYGAYGDATYSWQGDSSAEPSWLGDWRMTSRGLIAGLSSGSALADTGALAGDLQATFTQVTARATEDVGLEVSNDTRTIRLVARGTGIVLEVEDGTRRIVASAERGTTFTARLVLINSVVLAYMDGTLLGRVIGWAAADTTAFGLVARSRGGVAAATVTRVLHNPALAFGAGPDLTLADLGSAPITGFGLEARAPYTRLRAVGDEQTTVAGFFGEVQAAAGMTWRAPVTAPAISRGFARIRRTTR